MKKGGDGDGNSRRNRVNIRYENGDPCDHSNKQTVFETEHGKDEIAAITGASILPTSSTAAAMLTRNTTWMTTWGSENRRRNQRLTKFIGVIEIRDRPGA